MPGPRESLGAIPCYCCRREIPVKKSTGGSLSVSCPWCDFSAYAKEGTEAYRDIVSKLPKPATNEPEPNTPPAKQHARPEPGLSPVPAAVKPAKKFAFL